VKKYNLAFWKATGERMVRGAIAALVAAYLAGNIVFDTTNITAENVLALAFGGAVSALALALGVQGVKKNGPALTDAEVLNPPPPAAKDERGESVVGVLVTVVLVVLLVWLVLALIGAIR
jgi:hypothetical protein